MSAGDQPLLTAFEAALAELDAVAVGGNDERVVVGYQELELELAWRELEGALHGADPVTWRDALAELVIEAVAELRAEDDHWAAVGQRVLPVLIDRAGAQRLERRARAAVAHPFAEALIVLAAVPGAAGLRYCLRDQLEAWELDAGRFLEASLDNLRRDTRGDCVQELAPHHYVLDTGDGLDSSRLLILDELTPAAAETGVLAAVPAREVLSFVPFNRAGCAHLRALVNLARRGYESWPRPVADTVFYIAAGQAVAVPTSVDDDGTPRLRVPQALAEVQARLVGQGKW